MNSASQLESIFFSALEKGTAEERSMFLDDACAGDEALRRRIERMLEAQAGNFLNGATVERDARASEALPEGPGTQIGPYKLLQEIGEGGFGVVFMAEQTHPVQRKVALKVIKVGMDTRHVIARFEAERQALAMMDHPNIAKVFDAGTTHEGGREWGVEGREPYDGASPAASSPQRPASPLIPTPYALSPPSGRPYFVMELVKGVPITTYCDEKHLSLKERLELFIPVCQAVQHAHQKGIIHRDLKPTNVLVAEYDNHAVPKVIDFGVAKATGPKLTERTMFTEFGQVIGTVEYMSPEQAKLNQLDIDTRSDIYSLGVLLYELLTGSTPFARKRLQEAAFDEMLRIIREDEPPKPSTRLSTLAKGELSTVCECRGVDPRELGQRMRGELDWIVMKCLEKDRNRRYDTANSLALDVQHYLHDEPVQACPPSIGYRLKKFLSRHKGPVLAASLLLLALLAGIVGTTWGLVRAESALASEAVQAEAERQAKRDALAAVEAERKAKKTAEAREAETRAVLDFVTNRIFAAARPEGVEGGLGREVTLRQAIEAALPFVKTSFEEQPLIEAKLWMTLGLSYTSLGEPKIAEEHFRKARTLYRENRGPDDRETLRTMQQLAENYAVLGRLDDALKMADDTLARQRAKLGPHHPDTLRTAESLAYIHYRLGRYPDALKLVEEALALRKAEHGLNHPETLASMTSLAHIYYEIGRDADAVKLTEETLALRKARLGPDHPDTLDSLSNLASGHLRLGRPAEALKLYEDTLPRVKSKLGHDHPHTLKNMHNLAYSYAAVGRHADAVKLYEETLELAKPKFGADNPHTLKTMNNLAAGYALLGRHAESLNMYEQMLAVRKTKLGPKHPDTLGSLNTLAWLLADCPEQKLRDTGRAVDLARQAAALAPHDSKYWNTLGVAQYRYGDWKSAIAALEKSMELRNGGDGLEWFVLAMAYWQLGNYEQARKWYEQAIDWMDTSNAQDEQLRRFRAEAAGLLGITESQPSANPKSTEKEPSNTQNSTESPPNPDTEQ